jgi:hypothetical protein
MSVVPHGKPSIKISVEQTLEKTTGRAHMPPALALAAHSRPPIEVALSFDTTGSMYKYLDRVRSTLAEIVTTVSDMARRHHETVRLGVLAHGDYCDKSTYITKYVPLTDLRQHKKLVDFITDVQSTGGGDGPECYELALHKIRRKMGWTPGSRRILVMIGDDDPHEVGYSCNGEKCTVDWRDEIEHFRRMHIHTFAVEAIDPRSSSSGREFWQTLAKKTRGSHVRMTELDSLSQLVTAAVLKAMSDDAVREYGDKLRRSGKMTRDTEHVLTSVQKVVITVSISGAGDATAGQVDKLLAAALGSMSLTTGGTGATGSSKHLALTAGSAAGGGPKAAASAKPVCKHYLKGGCRHGSACEYQHPVQCRFYLSAKGCTKGTACSFAHLPPCRFFSERGTCLKGAECGFAHIAK